MVHQPDAALAGVVLAQPRAQVGAGQDFDLFGVCEGFGHGLTFIRESVEEP
ncbi:hypothetical protein BOA8489_03453 [Boseongicola aestuarii]|uniref:Uncharacterized protein n=1 Tax=Boseongicola aestuarii TaxID=1470561 RepID=A0A238J601_9RHOB|nr:hypothetical protein BOA8489_03453 [Boseongicola aestuarii]